MLKMKEIIEDLIRRYPVLAPCEESISKAVDMLMVCYRIGAKMMVCGNGGSAADALHIVGELAKSFVAERRLTEGEYVRLKAVSPDADYLYENLQGGLPAISLVNEVSLMTAYANDKAAELVFAQQVYTQGRKSDILLAISTSGNSRNVLWAAQVARMKGIHVLSLTGAGGGKLAALSDCLIAAPETETYLVQELHLPIYHCLCLCIEEWFFGGSRRYLP